MSATPLVSGPQLTPISAPGARDVGARYIRPLAARTIGGIAHVGDQLLTLDTRIGRVSLVDPATDDTCVVNETAALDFVGARGLALGSDALWYTTAAGVRRSPWSRGRQLEAGALVLGVGATAVAARDDLLYLVVGDELREHVLGPDGVPAQEPTRTVRLHGVGRKGIAATERYLWLTDDVEQTVYCLQRTSLETVFRAITALEGPTAIAARDPKSSDPDDADVLHVAYYEDEPFLKDNPWIDPCWEVRYRDRALIHELHVRHDPNARATWSSGHRLVMHYYVEVEPDDDVQALSDVQWRMSLPLDTARQRVLSVEPIGLPFDVVDEPDDDGASQRVAVFTIPHLEASSRHVLGWRATLEVFGIKHQVVAADLADAPLSDPAVVDRERARRYLVDDEDLDLDRPEIVQATAAAVGDEPNPWLAARRIRTWVYDRLEYEMGNADSPVGVLTRGTGSCGEYVSTIMALLRRAGIVCRVAGRYKCPYQPWSGAPLYPDFNHVWIDVHLPGVGWLPMESNPDDVVDGGPYPDRFLFGLPWRHVEVGKDISFEKVLYTNAAGRRRRIGARRLSRNHIRFDVLAEVAPVAP